MSEQDFLRPFPVVIAPTQLVQSTLEAPAAVTIIDREMIKAMNVREIPELMRRVPGVTVAYENGSNYFVAY